MTRPPSPGDTRLLRRFALALWLATISALGALRFVMRAFRHGAFEADGIAWAWLAGAVVVGLFAAVSLRMALRRTG